MIYKKAVIVEIQRDYSIVITRDGQFLRQDIPAGKYEIGDTLIVALASGEIKAEKSPFVYRLVSRLAVGIAACAVIAFGTYFGFQYLQSDSGPVAAGMAETVADAALEENRPEVSIAAETESLIIQENTGQKLQADSQEEEAVLSEESFETGEGMLSAEMAPAPLLYEGDHSLDMLNTDFSIDYADIKIDYRVEAPLVSENENQQQRSLLFNFIQNREDCFFNGSVDTILTDINKLAVRTFTFTFDNFEYGHHRSEVMTLENNEESFRLLIYGSFE